MADKRDYYEVLGVEKGASDSDIKSAFRRKAKGCHPDLHPNDVQKEAEFKELNEAYEVLSDPDKRSKYDQFGHAAFDPQMGGGNPFHGDGFDFGDIFSTIFGGGFGSSGQTRNGPMQGEDLRYNLTLTFEEAARGAEKEVHVTREEVCETCNGTGAKPGTSPARCQTCNGTGQVRTQSSTVFGASFVSTRPCSACRGTGKVITDPCTDCRGKGRVKRMKHLNIRIPAGIDDGQTINMRNEGEAGYKGGPRGNLYVTISVRNHPQFVRRGADLLLKMNIPYTTAVLGGEIVVPTLDGQIKYSIPQGTQNGTTFRLREQGIQRLQQQGKGDMLVTVNVDVPRRISDKERELLEQLAELAGNPIPQKRRKGFKK